MDWVQVDDKNGSLNVFGMKIPGCGKRKFLGVGRGNSWCGKEKFLDVEGEIPVISLPHCCHFSSSHRAG